MMNYLGVELTKLQQPATKNFSDFYLVYKSYLRNIYKTLKYIEFCLLSIDYNVII